MILLMLISFLYKIKKKIKKYKKKVICNKNHKNDV